MKYYFKISNVFALKIQNTAKCLYLQNKIRVFK